jgi:hypothetical protein
MNNKNCDKACTDLKLRQKRRWKLYATTLAHKPMHRVNWRISFCEMFHNIDFHGLGLVG